MQSPSLASSNEHAQQGCAHRLLAYQGAKMRRRFAHDQVCMPELLKFQLEPLTRHTFESNTPCENSGVPWSIETAATSANLSIVAQPEDVRLVPFQPHLACTVVY
jgi:hypothetical protein